MLIFESKAPIQDAWILDVWHRISTLFWIYSCMGADFPFKSLMTLFQSESTHSKAKDSINICLTPGTDIILYFHTYVCVCICVLIFLKVRLLVPLKY